MPIVYNYCLALVATSCKFFAASSNYVYTVNLYNAQLCRAYAMYPTVN